MNKKWIQKLSTLVVISVALGPFCGAADAKASNEQNQSEKKSNAEAATRRSYKKPRLFGSNDFCCSFDNSHNRPNPPPRYLLSAPFSSQPKDACAWIQVFSPKQIEFRRKATTWQDTDFATLTMNEAKKLFGKPEFDSESGIYTYTLSTLDSQLKRLLIEVKFDAHAKCSQFRFSGQIVSSPWFQSDFDFRKGGERTSLSSSELPHVRVGESGQLIPDSR